MDRKKQLILMEIVLIIILLVFCIIIEFRSFDFKRDCKETFDINGSCPCIKNKIDYPFMPNFTNINISNS